MLQVACQGAGEAAKQVADKGGGGEDRSGSNLTNRSGIRSCPVVSQCQFPTRSACRKARRT